MQQVVSRQASVGAAKLAEICSAQLETHNPQKVLEVWEHTAACLARALQMGLSVALPPLGVFERRTRPHRKGVILLLSDDFLQQSGLIAADPRLCDMSLLSLNNFGQPDEGCPRTQICMADVVRTARLPDTQTAWCILAAMFECMGKMLKKSGQVNVGFAPIGEFVSYNGVVHFHSARRRPLQTDKPDATVTVQSMLLTSERENLGRSVSHSPRAATRTGGLVRTGDQQQRTGLLPIRAQDSSKMPLQKSLPQSSIEFPPLLEAWSRTPAAAHVGAQDPFSPSHRIAASCSGAAAWLSPRLTPALDDDDLYATRGSRLLGQTKQRMHWWVDRSTAAQFLMDVEGAHCKFAASQRKITGTATTPEEAPLLAEAQECGLSLPDVHQTLQRYEHYVKHGVPDEAIAPINPLWLENVLAAARDAQIVQQSSAETIENMLSEMCTEVEADYTKAMKKAIVDHILTHDSRARCRASVLFVPNAPMLWGSGSHQGFAAALAAAAVADPSQSISFKMKHSSRVKQALARSTQVALKLLEIWHGQNLDSFLLVDLPQKADNLLHPEEFIQRQHARRAAVREALEEHWLPAVAAAVGFWMTEPRYTLSGGSDSLGEGADRRLVTLDSIACLLSTQARGVVERSLRAYENFFERFAEEHPRTPMEVIHLREGEKQEEAFLWLGLTSLDHVDAVYAFSKPLDQMAHELVDVFSHTVSSLEGLNLELGQERRTLWQVAPDEPQIVGSRDSIEEIIDRNLHNIEASLDLYDDFRHLLQEERRLYDLADTFASTREEYMEQVDSLQATEAAIREKCPSEIRLQLVSIECASMNEMLCQRASKAVNVMLRGVLRNVLLKNDELVKSFETAMNHMLKKPTSEEELVDLERQLDEFRTVGLKALLDEFASVCDWLNFIFECEDKLSRSLLHCRHFHAIFGSALWVHTIDGAVKEREVNLQREREALESKFKEQRNKFVEDLISFNAMVTKFHDLGNLRQVEDYLERLDVLRGHFARAHAEAEKLNAKERRLGWDESSFPELDMGEKAIEPFQRLWTLANTLEKASKQWSRAPLFHMDPAKVEHEVRIMWMQAQDLLRHFNEADLNTPAFVAMTLASELGEWMNTQVALLEVLCNKSLQRRHWARISQTVGFNIEPDNSIFTLGKLLDLDMEQHLPELWSISEAASKEYEIEISLEELQAQWQTVIFALHPWRQTGTYVVASACVEEVRSLVEDQLLRTHSMSSSPHAVPWLKHLTEWQTCLEATDALVQAWLRVQAAWTYLEPLFSGNLDLLRQMPNESRIFWQVDRVWRRFMLAAQQEKTALQVTRDEQLRQALQQCCVMVEQVEQGLNDYLDAKRLAFPRFFFVSNECLLQILAAGKDVYQTHVPECFTGIHGIELSEDGQAVGMQSSMGEVVYFAETLDLHGSAMLGAEELFTAVLSAMQIATRRMCINAVLELQCQRADTGVVAKFDWAAQCPLQAASCALAVAWSKDVVAAITQNNLPALLRRMETELSNLCSELSEQMVAEGRSVLGAFAMHRSSHRQLEQLICARSYHSEVVSALISRQVVTPTDFHWLSHLRHEIRAADAVDDAQEAAEHIQIVVTIAASTLEFGNEYIGNAVRMVVTPLTSRVFLSIVSAHQMHSSSLIEGPHGVGKTGTILELSYSLARYCKMLHCSGDLASTTVSSFLKGMVSTGSWCCLDGIQQIQTELLCNIAAFVVGLHQGLQANANHLELEGSLVALHSRSHLVLLATTAWPSLVTSGHTSCSVQLPTLLRERCRPVAMITPDAFAIAEVKLRTAGFSDASAVARRLVMLHRMSMSTSTSWWMAGNDSVHPDSLPELLHLVESARRMLKGLAKAGHLEDGTIPSSPTAAALRMDRARSDAQSMQRLAVYRACVDVLGPKVGSNENLVGAINQLMPTGLKNQLLGPDKRFPVVRERHREYIAEKGLQPIAAQEAKAVELHVMTLAQSGVILLGPAFAGKTTCVRSLGPRGPIAATAHRAKSGLTDEPPHSARQASKDPHRGSGILVTLHPKACSDEELLGSEQQEDGCLMASVFQSLQVLLDGVPTTANQMFSSTARLGHFGSGPGSAGETKGSDDDAPALSHTRSSVLQFLAESKTSSPRGHGQTRRHSLSLSHATVVAPADETLDGEETHETQCWVHLDGPVEAWWAESLHSVLDSSRIFHLPGGSSQPVPSCLRIIFETADLSTASPGIASRCGILNMYATSRAQGLGPSYVDLIESWKTMIAHADCMVALHRKDREEMHQVLEVLLDALLPMLEKEGLPLSSGILREAPLVKGVLSWLTQLLAPLKEKAIYDHICAIGANALRQHLHACIVLSCIWGIGNILASGGVEKRIFDTALKASVAQLDGVGVCPPLPESGSCFDYSWDDEDGRWCTWLNLLGLDPKHDLTSTAQLSSLRAESRPMAPPRENEDARDLFVHTQHSSPFVHLAGMAAHTHTQLLLWGPRGCGKTSCVAEVLRSMEDYQSHKVRVTMSATTSAQGMKAAIGGALEERQQGVRAPPLGMSVAVIFLDDVSLPVLERGSQGESPLELLRAFCCERGWYERRQAAGSWHARPYHFERLLDCFSVATGGGETPEVVSARLLWHFTCLRMESPAVEDCQRMFGSLAGFSSVYPGSMDAEQWFYAATQMYEHCKAALLPTPLKPQCRMGLGDLCRFAAGTCLPHTLAVSKAIEGSPRLQLADFSRLLVHECTRVFADRLSKEDKDLVFSAIREAAAEADWSEVLVKEIDGALANSGGCFSVCLEAAAASNPVIGYKEYETSAALEAMLQQRLEAVSELQTSAGELAWNPVLFEPTLQHLVRITRATRLLHGHCLLMGHAGAGQKPMVRLATALSAHSILERSLDGLTCREAWLSSMRELLHNCHQNSKNKVTNLLFDCCGANTATDVVGCKAECLEALHSVMTCGEVHGLLQTDAKAKVVELLRMESTSEPSRERTTDRKQTRQSMPQMSVSASTHAMSISASTHVADDIDPLLEGGDSMDTAQDESQQSLRSWAVMRRTFLNQCYKNVHLILLLPSNATFARRLLRRYPSFLHLSSIDYFDTWPQAALAGLARQLLSERADNMETCTSLSLLHTWAGNFFNTQCAGLGYKVLPVTFISFVQCFGRIATVKEREFKSRLELYAAATASLTDISRCVRELYQQLQDFHEGLQSAEQDKVASLSSFTTFEVSVTELEEKSKNATDKMVAAQQECQAASDDYEHAILTRLDAEERVQHAVQMLTTSDIDSVATTSPDHEAIVSAIAVLLPPLAATSIEGAVPDGIARVSSSPKTAQSSAGDGQGDAGDLLRRLRVGQFADLITSDDAWQQATHALESLDEELPAALAADDSAAGILYRWLKGAVSHRLLCQDEEAQQKVVQEAQRRVSEAEEESAAKQSKLAEAEVQLRKLEETVQEAYKFYADLELQIQIASRYRDRGLKLLDTFSELRMAWDKEKQMLQKRMEDSCFDAMLAAVSITHLGSIPAAFRPSAKTAWLEIISEVSEDASGAVCLFAIDDADLPGYLMGPNASSIVQTWERAGLPRCPAAVENGVIITHSRRPALCLDPQAQALKWLLKMEADNKPQVVSALQHGWPLCMKEAYASCRPTVLQDVSADTALEDLLHVLSSMGGSLDDVLLYGTAGTAAREPSKRLYLTSRLTSARFADELHAHFVLVDFSITSTAIEQEMMRVVASITAQQALPCDMPPAEAPRLPQEEEVLLQTMASVGRLLSGEELIESLAEVSTSRIHRISGQVLTSAIISNIGSGGKRSMSASVPQTARCMTGLYFALLSMGKARRCYDFSLQSFMYAFRGCADVLSTASHGTEHAVDGTAWAKVEELFVPRICEQVSVALLSRDRVLAAVLMSAHAGLRRSVTDTLAVSDSEVSFLSSLLTPATSAQGDAVAESCAKIQLLSAMAGYESLAASLTSNEGAWRSLIEQHHCKQLVFHASLQSSAVQTSGLMERVAGLLPSWWMWRSFQQLLLLLCMDMIMLPTRGMSEPTRALLTNWCTAALGTPAVRHLLAPPPTAYREEVAARLVNSSARSERPVLIATLLPGAVLPLEDAIALASRHHGWTDPEVLVASRSQHQQHIASMQRCMRLGRWVIYRQDVTCREMGQAAYWLELLGPLCMEIASAPPPHEAFRLWILISGSLDDIDVHIPAQIQDTACHLAIEAPVGIRAHMSVLLAEHCPGGESREALLPAVEHQLCDPRHYALLRNIIVTAHSTLNSMGQGGPMMSPYQFLTADAKSFAAHCCDIAGGSGSGGMAPDKDAQLFGLQQAVVELAKACHYGGRMVLLDASQVAGIFSDVCRRLLGGTSGDGVDLVDAGSGALMDVVRDSVGSMLPGRGQADIEADLGHVFGDAIAMDQQTWVKALDTLGMQERCAVDEATVSAIDFVRLLADLPDTLEACSREGTQDRARQAAAVLADGHRFQQLLLQVRADSQAIVSASCGKQELSSSLEDIADGLSVRRLPASWSRLSPLSATRLAEYLPHMLEQYSFLRTWIATGSPPDDCVWIGAFFSPSSFLTAWHADVAASNELQIHEAAPARIFMEAFQPFAADGCQALAVRGIFLEGCLYDETEGLKEAVCPSPFVCPKVHLTLRIGQGKQTQVADSATYPCPLLVVRPRGPGRVHGRHQLSNFVAFIHMPSAVDAQVWVRRGIVASTQRVT